MGGVDRADQMAGQKITEMVEKGIIQNVNGCRGQFLDYIQAIKA